MYKLGVLVLAFMSFVMAYGGEAVENDGTKVVNVLKYGAKGDGKHNDTKAINKAIRAAKNGAVVKVPSGRYLTGTIHLKSGITLLIDEDAVIIGSEDLNDYDSYVPQRDMSKYDTGEGTRNANLSCDRRWTKALILGVGVSNSAIIGGGVIDGCHVRDSLGEESMRGPHVILLAECDNIELRDFSVRRASNYAVMCYELKDSEINGLKISEGWDGIHIRGCKDVEITGCDIKTGDDAIAGGYWHNMKILDCRLNSSCNGVRMIEPSDDVEIGRCTIYGPGEYPHRTSGAQQRRSSIYGIVLEPGAWGDAPGHTENVYIHDVTIDNLLSPIVYSMGDNNTCSGLTIENVTATQITYNTTPLNRQDCVKMWDNISIKNMVVRKGK